SLRSRPHPALRATFSRFAGEGLVPDVAAGDWKRSPCPAAQEKGCFRTVRQGVDGERLLRREAASGWLRTRPNEKRRPGAAFLRGATLPRRLNPRRCPAPTSPPRTG